MSSSSGWETVGADKAQAKKKAKKKAGKQQQQQSGAGMPKVEDVLSHEQLTALYTKMGLDSADVEQELLQHEQRQNEVKERVLHDATKVKPSSESVNGANTVNLPQTKKQAKKPEKEPQKNKKAKTFEEALHNISVTDLKEVLDRDTALYPNNQVIWLRDAASYLNLALTAEDTFGLSSNLGSQPAALLTRETRKVLNGLFEDCTEAARQSGYETLLANLAHDMAKGLSCHGYLCMLQLMTEAYPSLATCNSERFAELRASYMNRPNIGLALLWAVGQGGRKDLGIGFRVWIDYMVPMIHLKHYSRFVVSYLSSLISTHSGRIKSSDGKIRFLYPAQFFKCFDTLFGTATSSINKELQRELMSLYPTLKTLSIGDCSSSHELFPEFLRRLEDCYTNPELNSVETKEELLKNLTQSLWNNQASTKHWQDTYISYQQASTELLKHLAKNWKSAPKSVRRNNVRFMDTFRAFYDYNNSQHSRDGLDEATEAIRSILSKMNRGSSSGGWFSHKMAIFFMFWLAGFMIQKDINKHHSFEKSSTGKFLKDVGMYDTVYYYGTHVMSVANNTGVFIRTKGPIYFDKTKKAVEPYARPVINIATRVYDDVDTYAREKISSINSPKMAQ